MGTVRGQVVRHKSRGHPNVPHCTPVRGDLACNRSKYRLVSSGPGCWQWLLPRFFDGVQKQNSLLVRGTWLCGSPACTILGLSCGFLDGGDVHSYSCLVTSAALSNTSGNKTDFICTRHGVLLSSVSVSICTQLRRPRLTYSRYWTGDLGVLVSFPIERLIRILREIVDHELICPRLPFILQAPLDFLEPEQCPQSPSTAAWVHARVASAVVAHRTPRYSPISI